MYQVQRAVLLTSLLFPEVMNRIQVCLSVLGAPELNINEKICYKSFINPAPSCLPAQ